MGLYKDEKLINDNNQQKNRRLFSPNLIGTVIYTNIIELDMSF